MSHPQHEPTPVTHLSAPTPQDWYHGMLMGMPSTHPAPSMAALVDGLTPISATIPFQPDIACTPLPGALDRSTP
eukprot:15002513-Alexandrium_andersonii.AAC.1